ncbi:hypothetical protein V8C44DRAFT_178438 [Trichoderma aethiopicum]
MDRLLGVQSSSPCTAASHFVRQHVNNVVNLSQIKSLDDFGLLVNRHWRFLALRWTVKSRISTRNEPKAESFTHSSYRTNCSCVPCGPAFMSIVIDRLPLEKHLRAIMAHFDDPGLHCFFFLLSFSQSA